MHVKKFFKAWLSDWLSLMSGAPTVPLAVLALYVSSTPYRVLYGTLAVFCAVFTSYRMWLKEHLALEAEQATNYKPQIEAKFTRLQIVPRLETVPLQAATNANLVYASDYDVMAEVYLTNLSAVACTIQKYEGTALLDGQGLNITHVEDVSDYELYFDQVKGEVRREKLASLAELLSGAALHKGIGYSGWVRFELLQVKNTNVDKVQFGLVLVDSFDGRHKVVRKELDPLGKIREKPGPAIHILNW